MRRKLFSSIPIRGIVKGLLMAIALVVGVNSANAKVDVTATYLTDPALTNESTNWALTSNGGNHNWNAGKQYHESWHNTFKISQTVTVPNGYYQISIQAVSAQAYQKNALLTATSGSSTSSACIKNWTNGDYAANCNWLALNPMMARIYAVAKVENGSLTVSFEQKSNNEWFVYGQMKLYQLSEKEYNNALELQNVLESKSGNTEVWNDGWTNQGNMYGLGRERFNETAYESGDIISKTITNLPSGYYDVTLHAKANVAWRTAASGNDIAEAYANDGKYSIPVEDKVSYDPTDAYNYTINNVTVEDNGQLKVGIRNIATGGNWYVVNLVDIVYKGSLEAALSIAKEEAAGIDLSKNMKSTVKTALENTLATYGKKNYSEYANATEVKAAITALNAAASNAETSISNYAAAKDILDAAKTKGLDEDGQAAYAADESVAALQAAYNNGTLEAVTPEQKTACEAALISAVKAQTTPGSDMTLAINNWDFLNCTNNNFPGWTIVAPNGGNRNAYGNTCVEYWIGTAANGSFDYYQIVTDLPVGKYKLSASMWNTKNAYGSGTDANGECGVYGTSSNGNIFAGITTDTDGANLTTYTTDESVIVSDGQLRLGVKNNTTMSAQWFGVDWIKLTYVGGNVTPEDVAALEATIPEGAMNADVATNLTNAKNALDGEATWDNYAALSAAIEAAKASIDAYKNAAKWLPVNKTELANTNFIAPNVYKEYITDVETGLEAGTLTDEKALSLTDIRVGHHEANYIDDILMDAWDAEPMDWSTYHINTWSTEGDNDGSNFKVPFFEYWTSNNSLEAKDITGTIEGLEPGNYAVTALVRVQAKANEAPYGIKMYVNDGETQPIEGTRIGNTSRYLQKASAFGTVGQDGKLTVTFSVNEDNNISWLAFKNVNYVKGATSIADFKATEEPTLLNLNGTEAFFVDDEGITYIQDANANVGLAIKGYDIDFTEEKQILSGQLFGTASGDTIIVDKDYESNSVIVSEGKATPKTLTPAEAALAESTFLLANIEQVEITEEEEVKYAEAEDGKVEIDNRLCEDLVVNTGDVLNMLAGITFLNEEGTNSVIAPRVQDDVVPVLWKAPSGITVGDAVTESEPIDLTTEDVQARMANLKAGDALNIAIETTAPANIIVKNENGDIYTIPVMAEETNVEVPVTAFMEKDIQNHGVEIFADSEDLKAKYVTVRNAKYPDTENSIWLGEGNDVTLGKQHFGDVREGDMLEAEGEETVMAIGEEEIENGELTEDQAASVQEQGLTVTGATKVTFMLGNDMRLDITDNEEGESFNQGDKDLSVEGMIMTYGGNDPEGAVYEYAEAYPAANNFKTVTDGIDQFPVDNEDKAYNKDDKNLPTKGTFYVFEPTKDGQIEATVGVEGGKTIIVTEEGEAIVEEKKNADFEGPITFPVEATKTYYLFANDTNLKLFGFKFTPNDPNAENTVKDIATFKLLSANSIDGDTLLLKDAIVTYIKGDNVYVEDASGAIDFYRTKIQYYVGQKLNGYIIGSNDIVENMPVLLRTDGTKYGQFKVTENVKPEATAATIADVTNEANLARFMKLEYVELTNDAQGFKVLANPETGESVLLEDRFGVFYTTGDLFEKVEGIVGMNKEGNFAFWPTSQEGIVISDGFTKNVETELDVTNKEEANSKNNPVVGISVTLDGAYNAGSGSSMAGAMTSKGYKLRTANGSPDKNSAKFTVNDNQKVFDMTINAVANYAAKDTEKPCITVTKVEVDGKEVSFEGGEFPAKGASDCGSLILKGINAEKDIVIYFDNSNAEGTQLNMAYAITCRGEKVYTTKEKDLLAEAKKLAEDREAVAVGLLDDAIEAAEAGNTSGLKKAVDQFKADNADLEKDETDKVGTATENWTVNSGNNSNRGTYSKNGITLVEHYGDSQKAIMISQEVSVDNGNYNIEVYASSYNERGEDGAALQETSGSCAYVFGTSGDNTVKTWIAARKGEGTGLLDDDPKSYAINGVLVENGKLTIGLATDKEKQTGWHTIQIKSLKWATTAKAAYASEKAKLVALLEQANELLSGDQFGGRAKLEAAVADANEAKESIRLNIDGMVAEVAKLQKAIEKFKAAGKVFIQNVATGKYLAAGANWGTHAVLNNTGLDFEITTNSDGTKNFDSQVSNGGNSHFLNGEYVDGASFGWTVEQLSNGNYTIYNGEKYLTAGDNDLVVLGDNADEWRFITVDERKETLAAATSSAPVDATFLVKGANYGRNDQRIATAWQVSKDCTNKNLSGGEDKNGTVGNNCAESYHSTFTISQLVEDAPAGTYVVTAQGFYRQDGGNAEDAPVYFANDEKQEIGILTGTENSMTDAGISFKSGLYALQSITVVVEENGTLTIGVQGTATSQWVIWDNFQLKYYGVGGTPTFIDEAKVEPARSFEQGAVYNLRGQKVANSTEGLKKGLYIVNGKKVVIK